MDELAASRASATLTPTSTAKERAPMMRNAVLATLAAAASATVGFCNDKDRSCAAWGADGECTGDNAEHMKTVRSASN